MLPTEPMSCELPLIENRLRRPRLVSVVCPVFNEEAGIRLFAERLLGVLDGLGAPYEVLFVEDDSPDESMAVLRRLSAQYGPRVKVLSLSRRFGHQASLAAGLHRCRGDVAICMDSDLQHPPEMLAEMLEFWAQGYQIVYTCRGRHQDRGRFKEFLSRSFYRVLDQLSEVRFEEGTADFRLMDRAVIDAFDQFEERNLFVRGLVNWMGYRRKRLEYDAPPRVAGNSQYSFRRMLSMGLEAIFSFSLLPLRLSHVIGAAGAFASLVYAVWVLASWMLGRLQTPGYSSLCILITFMGSLNLLCLGITAEYIGRIHRQSQKRPLYLIKEQIGFDSTNGNANADGGIPEAHAA
jgi:glycosyltransferase involved in cell wall biosynthesis